MIPMINFSNPIWMITGLILIILVVIVSYSEKESYIIIPAIIVCIALIIAHTVESFIFSNSEYSKAIIASITIDFIFNLIVILSYLWMDTVETKEKNKKDINNNLEWFWTKEKVK